MKKINIIYLLPEMKGASGGAKVIYKHSAILNIPMDFLYKVPRS